MRPPLDLKTVVFRQTTLRELSQDLNQRHAFERAYLAIRELFNLLESSDTGKRFDPIGRRLEILRAVERSIELLANSFENSGPDYRALSSYARSVRESTAHRDLVELLAHEGKLATVQVKLTLAYDGRLRGFELVRAEENVQNRYHRSPLARILTRLRLLFRGYHLREAEVLARLINGVFDGLESFVIDCFELVGQMEFYLAALGFADLAREKGLATCLPDFVRGTNGTASGSEFKDLYNPFLLLEENAPVPCDLNLASSGFTIVTGPNSGGKTRLLQAFGLAQLLAQSGFFVPAKHAQLGFREGLFVSIVDDAAPDQREGRLGTELIRIRKLFEELRVGVSSFWMSFVPAPIHPKPRKFFVSCSGFSLSSNRKS